MSLGDLIRDWARKERSQRVISLRLLNLVHRITLVCLIGGQIPKVSLEGLLTRIQQT